MEGNIQRHELARAIGLVPERNVMTNGRRADGGAGDADGGNPFARVPLAANQSFPCRYCEREFPTKIGLGVHVASAHPAEANEAIDVERTKPRWSSEETLLVARAEANAILAGGVRFMNQHLLTLFPHRTLDAIKGKRRNAAYQRQVEQFCQQGPAAVLRPNPNDGEVVPVEPEGPVHPTDERADDDGANVALMPPADVQQPESERDRIVSAIRKLLLESGRVQAHQAARLRAIALAAIEGTESADDVGSWLGAVFPTAERPHTRQIRARPPNERETKKQKRKREYGMVQELYKKNLNFCLQKILDGDAPDHRPASREFDAYWRPLLETRSAADGRMPSLVGRPNAQRSTIAPIVERTRLDGNGE